MERYPFDVLPSGNLFSDLVDFTDYYDDPFLIETSRQMTKYIGGEPMPFDLPQEPQDFTGFNEFVGKQTPGFGNLPQEELSCNDSPDDQPPECDISPQVEPIHYDYLPQKEQLQVNSIKDNDLPQEDQLQVESIQYNDLLQEEQPQVESIQYKDLPQDDQPQKESIQYNDLPQAEQLQVESIQYNDLPQKEQSQGAAPPEDIIYPEYSYCPQQRVWVHPLSALLSPSYQSSTTSHTMHGMTNEPMSNSNDMSVVVSRTTQRLFVRKINVIEISPIIGMSLKVTCGDIPAISPQTPLPRREKRSERVPKKIPVPVLLIKPLVKTGKSRARRIRMTRPPPSPSVSVERKCEYRCNVPGCNKTFTSTNYLKQHKTTHSDLKPYKCDEPLCGSQFARFAGLNHHIRCKHSSEKLYRCDYCKKRFARRDHFLRHENTCIVRKMQRKNK